MCEAVPPRISGPKQSRGFIDPLNAIRSLDRKTWATAVAIGATDAAASAGGTDAVYDAMEPGVGTWARGSAAWRTLAAFLDEGADNQTFLNTMDGNPVFAATVRASATGKPALGAAVFPLRPGEAARLVSLLAVTPDQEKAAA